VSGGHLAQDSDKTLSQESQAKKPSLLINAVSNYAAMGSHMVVGFFLTPFVISHLGKTGVMYPVMQAGEITKH